MNFTSSIEGIQFPFIGGIFETRGLVIWTLIDFYKSHANIVHNTWINE